MEAMELYFFNNKSPCFEYYFIRLNYSLLQPFVGEGNGTPVQYSCLENPMDGGAW